MVVGAPPHPKSDISLLIASFVVIIAAEELVVVGEEEEVDFVACEEEYKIIETESGEGEED